MRITVKLMAVMSVAVLFVLGTCVVAMAHDYGDWSDRYSSYGDKYGSNDYGDDAGSEQYAHELSLVCLEPAYWASMDDYNNSLLSNDYELSNVGNASANSVMVQYATATNGVTAVSIAPDSWDEIPAGTTVGFTIKWDVGSLTAGSTFITYITICADCGTPPVEPPDDDCDRSKDSGGYDYHRSGGDYYSSG